MGSLTETSSRGQSSVLGTVLLVAIAVVLGSIVVIVGLGIVEEPVAVGQASVQVEDGDSIVMVAASNVDEVYLRDESGKIHGRFEGAGDSVSIDLLDPRREYSVISVTDGQKNLVREITRSEIVGELSDPSPSPAAVAPGDIEGDGSKGNPYIIRTDSELQAVANVSAGFDADAYYRLGNDIDASKTDQWNGGNGFTPIDGFGGTFDGDGNTIYGLTIDRSGDDGVGLFADSSGTLADFSVEDFAVSGDENVGGIVGVNTGTVEAVSAGYQIKDIYADAVSGNRNVGGLVGNNEGTVSNSFTTGKISGDGSEIAGLVGVNSGTVDRSYSTATVTIDGLQDRHVAGLVGTNDDGGTITDSYATGDVTVTGVQDDYPRVGGLVGENFGLIEGSYATGDVTGADSPASSNHNYGGLVGINWDGTIRQSYATGDVETDGRAGALVGRVSQLNGDGTATIVDSYATGDVTSRSDAAGGLVGSVHSGYDLDIETSFAVGAINGDDTGGVVGENNGKTGVTDVYWDTMTTGQDDAVGSGSTLSDTSGLETAQMTGSDAEDNMDGFDFTTIWKIVSNGYPALK
jgi:flagellin-like protein